MLKPEDMWVGQRLTLVVELLAPGYFASAPSFELKDPPGLLLMPPAASPVVGSEVIGGVAHTVQRHEISVIAHRSGEQTIPPFTVRFRFKRHPLDKESVEVSLKTEAVRFEVKQPPGAGNVGALVSARSLRVEESWSPDPAAAKVKQGDAFTRTITFTAADVPAMAFPPFRPGAIDGLGIYPKAPEVLDHSERGVLTGERRDSVIYVCQRAGRFTAPAAKFVWWDLDTKELKTILLPAKAFAVAPNPALATSAHSTAAAHRHCYCAFFGGLSAAVLANAFAFLFWATRRFWQPLIDAFRPLHLAPLNPGDTLQNIPNA